MQSSVRQIFHQGIEFHRLDEVGVKAGCAGLLAVFLLTPTCEGDQSHFSAPGLFADSATGFVPDDADRLLGLIQAVSQAYFDVFFASAVLAVSLAFPVLLMTRSVAEKGEHIGAE